MSVKPKHFRSCGGGLEILRRSATQRHSGHLLGTMRQFVYCLLFTALPVHLLQAHQAGAVVVPRSSCYVLDNSSHIHDFTTWIGHAFDYDGKQDADLAVRFCKDVETRSQTGYVDFGRFDKFNHFVAGSGPVNFVQEFYNGDLRSCETSYDKLGRTAQVNIICGSCPNAQCKGALGCICNVTYESACRVLVELAIPCEEQGSRVFEGFTVGFHPRSWEVVYDGMTQLGFEKSHHEFSFKTEQAHVSLYMTAIASLSRLVQKPIVKTFPENGLKVKLSGSAAEGKPPTTLSPSVLVVEWRCDQVSDSPYEVQISIPIEGYDPIQFTLTKFCESRQSKDGDTMRGWAMFGVVSCIFIVLSSLICCGGFLYKTRVEQQHGLDALPGMAILTACLDTLSGGGQGYSGAGEFSSGFANQASWERQSASSVRTTTIQSERKYGSM